jgi:multiple sugar transport system substrate-binding protein
MVLSLAGVWLGFSSPALAATEIVVGYPYPTLFDGVFKKLAAKFSEQHPDIKVKFEPTYKNYEEATQRLLRQALTDQLPDISFQGLNRLRIFVERGIAVPIDDLIAAEKDWAGHGVNQAMQSLGKLEGKAYGLPFAVSTPVIMINKDLVKKVGGDLANFPKTWAGVYDLARKIDALDKKIYGMHYVWTITGNWMWQALIYANCGAILDASEKKVVFDDAVGQKSMQMLDEMVKQGRMHDLTQADAYNSMLAGTMGMLISSVAGLSWIERSAGDKFQAGAAPFPEVKPGCGRLPAGGNVALLFTKDPQRQKAAWEFIKFVTSADGQTIQAGSTGYMPTNSLATDDPKYLGKFYDENPDHKVTLGQMAIVTKWYSFPGENALKITDVIKDHLQSVVNQSAKPDEATGQMAEDVQRLLPK